MIRSLLIPGVNRITVLINQEFKAVVPENLDVLYEYVLTDCSEVKFLWAANGKKK